MNHVSGPVLGRRSFLGLATTATALVGLAVAGCTPGSSSKNGSNRLRVATSDGVPSDTLDPLRQEHRMQRIIVGAMFESLVDLDTAMSPVPRLAESFGTPDDGVTWDFTLRTGVTFHDGSPLTPDDVIYSFSRVLDPNIASGNSLAGQLAGILRPERISAVDDRTIRFALDKKYVFFPNAAASHFARVYKAGTADFAQPIGTGPFVFGAFKPGQSFAANRFDKYWDGAPAIEGIDVVNYAEESTRLSALVNGDIDVLFDLPVASAPDVVETEGLSIIEDTEAQWIALALDTTVAPFDNPEVIRAIKMSVDRDRVIEVGLGGYGTLGDDQPIASGNVYFANLPRPAYDPDAAKGILAQAGYGDGLRLPALEVFDLPLITNVALIVQQQLKDVGIQFDIKRVSQATFYDTSWLKAPFWSNTFARRPADEILKLCFTSDGKWNMSKRKDPEIDAAIEAAAETADLELQKKQYAIAQRLIAERDSTVISVQAARLTGVASGVSGVVPDPLQFLDLRKASISQ